MIFKLNLFLKELLLFGLTLILGISSARMNVSLIEKSIIDPGSFSLDNFIIFLTFFIIISVIFVKFKKINAVFLRFFLILVVFSGTQILIGSFLASPWDLFGALIITVLFIAVKNVLIHNFGMILGIAGVSSLLGITISPKIAVFLLVILSFYDIFAVYISKHMIRMAEGMVQSGSIFGFIIPFNLRDILSHKEEAKQKLGEKFMILGSGDVGLPLVMASSVALVSLEQAVITAVFSIFGLFVTHILFMNQGSRRPMAALPPIATMTIIGYLLAGLLY